MASSIKNLSDHDPNTIPEAKGFRIGIIISEYHTSITQNLLKGCTDTLLKHHVHSDDIHIQYVPGSFELPYGAKLLAENIKKIDAVISLGCVIKGDTNHDDYINHSIAGELISLSTKYDLPFVFGVLTTLTEQQAIDRSGGKYGNKGTECAVTAIKLIHLKNNLEQSHHSLGFR